VCSVAGEFPTTTRANGNTKGRPVRVYKNQPKTWRVRVG